MPDNILIFDKIISHIHFPLFWKPTIGITERLSYFCTDGGSNMQHCKTTLQKLSHIHPIMVIMKINIVILGTQKKR